MQKLVTALLLLVVLISCDNKPSQKYVPESSGALNALTVVMDNNLWQDTIGETIREKFAGPVDGLPRIEPLFDINQMPQQAFTGFMRKQRTFLEIKYADTAGIEMLKNPYARPQAGVVIQGPTSRSIVDIIRRDSAKIVSAFKNEDVQEKIRRINLSLKDDEPIQKAFGISLKFPSAYRYAKQEDGFFWIRKDIPHGDMNITIYEVPLERITDTNTIGAIIGMRNQISGDNITVDEGARFATEAAYAPYLYTTTIDGKPAYETKGTWEVRGKFMAGPFINYAIKDEKNNRYLVLEGFIFKPSASQRDNMFEPESILKSVKFLDKK